MGLEQSKKIYQILNDLVASNSNRRSYNSEALNDLENYDYTEGKKRHKAGSPVGGGLGSYNLKGVSNSTLWDLASIIAGAGTSAFLGPGWGAVAGNAVKTFGPDAIKKLQGLASAGKFDVDEDFDRRRQEDDFWERFV